MNDEIKYPWQQALLDAFIASSESLPGKIDLAERAIAARISTGHQLELAERIALDDALRALRLLAAETRPGPSRSREGLQDKKRQDIA
jgi:hypothetical protein